MGPDGEGPLSWALAIKASPLTRTMRFRLRVLVGWGGGTVKKDIWGRGCGGHVEVCPERPVIPEGPLSRLWDPSPTPAC